MTNYLSVISRDFLLSEPALYVHDVSDLEIPRVLKDGEHYTLDMKYMTMEDFVSMTITNHKKSCSFTAQELDRLPHELIRCLFSANMETALGRIEQLGDDSDTLTPDIVNHITMTCAEISTSIFSADHARRQKLRNKGVGYESACSSRKLSLGYISVSVNQLLSDFSFDTIPSLASDIITAYSIGRAIQSDAKKYGYQRNTNDENTDIFSVYNDQFEESSAILDRLPKSSVHIESEDWNVWSNHSEMDYSIYKAGMEAAVLDMKRTKLELIPTQKLTSDSFNQYLSEVRSHPIKHHSKKLPVPMAIVSKGHWYDSMDGFTAEHPMAKFWQLIMNESINLVEYHSSYEELKYLDMTVEDEKILRESKHRDLIWREAHRVEVKLPEDVLMYVSQKGLYAKSRDEYVENTGDTKGFDIGGDMDYSDYEDWLTAWDDMTMAHSEEVLFSERMSGLFDSSCLPSESDDLIKTFLSTRLAASLDFFSAASAELNINLRKPTPVGKMYISNIRGYNARIAMHNTGSDKHTFYSILVKKNDIELPTWTNCFTRWIDIGDYLCTEICSTRKHDLSMHLSMLSKSLSIIAMTRNVFSDKLTLRYPGCRSNKEILLSILICLENSNQTSEVCMLPRFNYMQTNVYLSYNANYAINASKFPVIVRSRLSSYIINCLINSFNEMAVIRDNQRAGITLKKFKDDDESDGYEDEHENDDEHKAEGVESNDKISNAISFVSGMPLKNYEEALLLSYLGIYHNKDKAEKNQSYFQIFSKLLKLEIKMRDARPEYMLHGMNGNVNPADIRAHEFSGIHLRNSGLAILSRLQSKGIDESTLMRKIAHNLDNIYYEELATLKASASISIHGPREGEIYSDKKFDLSDDQMKTKINKKVKAMQGVVDVMREIDAKTTNPYREFKKLVLCLELHGGIVAVLFKKNQLNGVREIFILTMIARIVIRLLESVSRTIATDCDGEYLTKGSEKASASPNHYSKVVEKLTPEYESITLSDSLDCQTWCQNFVMPSFGNMLAVITRSWPELSEVLRGILNSVSSKRHEMPFELMKFFVEKPNEQSRDASMRELKSQFLGDGGDLVDSMSCYIKNVSNMMQGILHYTTTVTHIGHLYTCGDVVRAKLMSHKNIADVVYTVKCSSDDASIMISVIVRKSLTFVERANVRKVMAWMSEWIRFSYPMMCAKVSKEKSTCLVFKQVEEFNSQWTYKNTSLSVPTKFGFAAVIGSSYRSVTEKQRLDHNLINDYLANGGTMQSAKVIEFSCAMQHYEALGIYTSREEIWNMLREDIKKLDHYFCYKYIESHPVIGTLMGFDFTQYSRSKTSSSFRLTEGKVKKMISGQIDDKLGMTISANMIIGSDKMYYKFMETLEKDLSGSETKQRIIDDPSKLYRYSDSIEDSKDRIYIKSITPGIGRSFAFMSYSLQQQSSSYILTSPSMTISIRDDSPEKDHIWVRRKMSLPAYLNRVIAMDNLNVSENIQKNEMYDNILDAIKPYMKETLRHIGRRGKKIMKLHLPKLRHGIDIDLMSCAKYLWFSVQNGHDLTENYRCFQEYQKRMDWLCYKYEDTRNQIIMRGHDNPDMVIYTAVTKYVETEKSLSFMTAARKTSTLIGTLVGTIIRLYKKDCVLVKTSIDMVAESTTSKLEEIESMIVDSVLIPPVVLSSSKNNIVKKLAYDLLNVEIPFSHDIDIIGGIGPHYKNLLLMTKLVSTQITQSEIKEMILTLGSGFLVSYVKAQNRQVEIMPDGSSRTVWTGAGTIRLDFRNNGHCLIEVFDNTVIQISTNKSNSLHSIRAILTRAFRFLRLKYGVSELLGTTGLTINRDGKVHLRSEGKRGIPVLPLWSVRSDLDIVGKLKIDEGKCLTIDIFTKERLVGLNRPHFLQSELIDRRWMKSEPIKFFPKVNHTYQSSCRPSITTMNSLITSSEDTYEQFVKTSLTHRLQALGKLTSNKYRHVVFNTEEPYYSPRDRERDIELMLEMDFDDDFDFLDDVEVEALPEENDDDIENMDSLNYDNLIGDEVIKMNFNQMFTDYSNLLIWDKWIDDLEDISGKHMRQLAAGEYRNEDIDEIDGLKPIIDKLVDWGIISSAIEKRNRRAVEYADLSIVDDDEDWLATFYKDAKPPNQSDDKEGEELNINDYLEVTVPGDGLCGSHSVHRILRGYGLGLSEDEVLRELREMEGVENTFLAQTLKEMCERHGVNLIVYNMKLGRIETGVYTGKTDAVIAYRPEPSPHFNPMHRRWDIESDEE